MRITVSLLLFMNMSWVSAQQSILLNNVQIFNGKDERLVTGNLLISDNLIKKISSEPIHAEPSGNTTVIDANGRFLIPGLIDAHAHLMLESLPMPVALNADITYLTIAAAIAAEREVMRGFTTVRDLAGPSFGLKRAIDEKLVKGPRIYPSGAMISQTSGHGDYYGPNDIPRQPGTPLNYLEKNNVAIIADGVDQVLMRVREQLRLGATQIKLSAGGGIASPFDPLDASQYTEEELRAAVNAAENWGTYVTVHAYTARSIQTAIKAGVKCIEHGQLLDEPTAKLMADKSIWLSLQPFLDDEDAIRFPESSANRSKQLQIIAGTDNAYKLAKKYKLKLAFGTDCLFDSRLAMKQGTQLSKLSRWFTPFEILKMATSLNAELLAMSGARNPYAAGKLGVIEEGAYADLILVDGNPLKDINLIRDPEKNFVLIMKDGIIYKNMTRVLKE